MKKGVISLKALVVFTVHVLITIGLIYALFLLITPFFEPEPTEAERTLDRIILEAEELNKYPAEAVKEQGDVSLDVPLSGRNYLLVIYDGTQATPTECPGFPCICAKGEVNVCKQLPISTTCNTDKNCKKPCLEIPAGIYTKPSQDKTITLKRTCNTIDIA